MGWRKKTGAVASAGPRQPRGLIFLALFLALAGVVRLGDGVGRALARTESDPAAGAEADTAAQQCTPDAGTMELLSALKSREARLAEQEKRAAEKEQALALARREIDSRLSEMQRAEEALSATIAQADKASDKDVGALVAMYESMKPKDAARLFAEMEPDFAAGFLSRMQPEAAASVMAGLEPAQAYAISVMLAGRNARAPKS